MRRAVLDNLVAWMKRGHRKPLVVRGLRQVGKTFSIKEFGREHFRDTAHFDFERQRPIHTMFSGDLDPRTLLRQMETHHGKRIVAGETLLFMDEIQTCPRAMASLRYFLEEMPDLHVIAAGSQLEFAMEDVAFPVGRVEFLRMNPLSFSEFLHATGNELLDRERPSPWAPTPIPESAHQRLCDLVRQYAIVGGMPEAVRCYVETNSLPEVARIHGALVEGYLQDFVKYGGRVDRDCLARVFERIPSSVGQQIKYTRLYPEKRIEQIKCVLSVLERSLIVHRVAASSASGLPLGAGASDKVFKYILADIGLMRHLCGLPASALLAERDLLHSLRGGLAEQLIGQEMLAERGGSENDKLYYWARAQRTSNAEVDYLSIREGRIVPVEVKSGPAGKLRSMRIFLEEHPHCREGWVFHSGNVTVDAARAVTFLPLYAQLREPPTT